MPEEYLGAVIEKLGPRRGEMIEMKNPGQGLVRVLYRIPARGLFGYRSEFLTDTRGTGIMHHRFLEYGAWAGPLADAHRAARWCRWRMARSSRSPWRRCRSGHAVRVAGRAGVRGDDRRREFASGRHGRESDEGEEADEHAHAQATDENIQSRAAAGVDAGRRARVYRGR